MESAHTTTIAVTTVKDKEAGRPSSTLSTGAQRENTGGLERMMWIACAASVWEV
jgi:hypothetical protein